MLRKARLNIAVIDTAPIRGGLANLFLLFCLNIAAFAQDYETDKIIIAQVGKDTYMHTTFLQTQSFGKVGCNGMVVVRDGEAIVFDTPVDDSTSALLIDWLRDKQKARVKAVIATHFHEDCVGGLNEFHKRGIASFADQRTIASAQKAGFPVPQNSFDKKKEWTVGGTKVLARFVGEGHTRDNIVGYFPAENMMFGGCLVKEIGAGKGNLADANEHAWSATMRNLKAQFPKTKLVIPGHGKPGGLELVDYTEELFDGGK